MFPTKELDSKYVDEALLICINNLFTKFETIPLQNFTELIDQKILINICEEMDDINYISMKRNFLFEKNIGIKFAEIKEILTKMIELLKKLDLSFKNSFNKDFNSINVNSLINLDKVEIKKLVNLIILSVFNCPNKNIFIDKIGNFEEFHQQELIKIVERYMYIDDNTRESINNRSRNISNRNTLTNYESISNLNLIESEFTQKFMSRIENLEKERDNLEKEKDDNNFKFSDLENEIEKLNLEKENFFEDFRKSEEIIKNLIMEKEELNKTVFTQQLHIKELEELTKEAKNVNEYKIMIEDKEAIIQHLQIEIKDLKYLHENENKNYEEKIEILQEKNSNNLELKSKYEKIKEMLKDYGALKEKTILYDAVNKEFNNLKNNYDELLEEKENLAKLLEEKSNVNLPINNDENKISIKKSKTNSEDYSYYIEIIQQKDSYIKALEIKNKNLQELKTNSNDINNTKEDKLKLLETEILLSKSNNENLILKRNEEIEMIKKENLEIKERYEKEFELMASSVYNLGINYWSMKMEYAQKIAEKPSWLIKERQKYYNGDF